MTESGVETLGSAQKLAFLRQAVNHPERPATVTVVETHYAWVFLGDRIVRKLKKPIRSQWLDFSTSAHRFRACAAEVALNRPLAPDVYLGVDVLVSTPTGALALDRPGLAVDFLVRMRRLPAALALDRRAPWLRPADLEPLAGRLIAFYGTAAAADPDPAPRLAQVSGSLANLEERLLAGPLRQHHPLMAGLRTFADCRAADLAARVAQGRVVDAHGDLRPEHLYLTTPPRILDRLEFGRELRLIDWLEDMSLLAVDLEYRGQGWIGERLMRRVAQGLGDRPPTALWCFYRAWRAMLRAVLAVEHVERAEHPPSAATRFAWWRGARAFLAIAERHAARLNGRASR